MFIDDDHMDDHMDASYTLYGGNLYCISLL